MINEKYIRNLKRVLKVNENEKYCWASLESVASAHSGTRRIEAVEAEDLKEDARRISICKQDSQEVGTCWCGKFTKEPDSVVEA